MMREYLNFQQFEPTELDMYNCGVEDCRPGHFYGPAVREHYLIHIIRKGKGRFRVGDQVYPLQQGQGFLICPDVVTYYQADQADPWHYSWVGFNGTRAEAYLKAAGLRQTQPVIEFEQDELLPQYIAQMVAAARMERGREARLKGLLYLFMSRLIQLGAGDDSRTNELSKKELYVKQVIEYIRNNYSYKLSVQQLAADVGLDRSYLCMLFKELLQLSPQEYLIQFRMAKACRLMANLSLSIGDIARSVGYDDPLQFSKSFKKWSGQPPGVYRQQQGERP
jgi:AraC-like DNA-binding protein